MNATLTDSRWFQAVSLLRPVELVRETCWVQDLILDCQTGAGSARTLSRLHRRKAALENIIWKRASVPKPHLTYAI